LSTVTNCSFGGYTHAMDGSGWEAFCLGKVSGKDKPGHIVVAGAGSGDGRALRASLAVRPGSSESVVCNQSETTTYNFWCRALSDSPLSQGWHIEVLKGDSVVFAQSGHQVPGNLWNGRQQSTFAIHGAGQVVFRVSRDHCDDSEPTWFDCYINHQDDAVFLDHINLSTVAEPAVFPGVLAVGLVKGSYSPDQEQAGAKPDVLIAGNGPISFRLPELVARVAEWLSSDPLLDVAKVKQRLGKFPSF
ncbi:MAG: hypothetical protein K8F91_19345, partial [Candidatus Obscuribacterales bacterium]|nr:hypothetical protein [Candidatus Obscuribacterales bacterium]